MSMQGLVKKKFVLYYSPYYSPDFAGGERIQLVEGIDFFTEDKGFRRMEIDEIESMKYDSTLTISYLRLWRVE